MIVLKSRAEIEEMRRAGQIVAAFHQALADMIRPGITTLDIESFAVRFLKESGAKAYTIGYNGYPFATCASVNDVIAHGFPNQTPLKEGDIVTIDIVAEANGWIGDSAWSYAIGEVSEEARKLMRVTKECLDLGIEKSLVGNRIGDVMHAVQTHAEQNGFSVVRDLLGHGVGREMHEEPNYPHVGKPGKGFRLKEGMVLTIEPMLNAGIATMKIDADGWTARTADGSLSAQYEHTIAITADGPIILTEQ
ncbi:type I methionyl aminopeptidase [Paenibacillus solani]|uniref:type I methionyl aminopeptidase n=1 Tax=Paenibacillus solani TaxID=1705565 RepID=UPI003D281456